MKTKNVTTYLAILAVSMGLFYTACKKEEEEKDEDTSYTSDNALAEGIYNDVANISDEGAKGNLSSYLIASESEMRAAAPCASISHDTTATPHIITIDFGTTNCLCKDGINRRGKILVSYSGRYSDSASTHTISFDNYFVNNHKVMGTKTVTNNGRNAAGHLTFSIVVNGSIIKSTGETITWQSSRKREWIEGESTPLNWLNDVYLITGTANGTNAAGKTYSMTITTPLRKEMDCRYFVSGAFTLNPSDKSARSFDFGSGECDNKATVTIQDRTYDITLN